MQQAVPFLLIILMFVIYYFILIRPQQKKQKELEMMRNALEIGDKVVTIGGFVGKVVNTKEDTVTIDVGQSRLTIMRWGISSKMDEDEE